MSPEELKSTLLIAVLVLLALSADFLTKQASAHPQTYLTWQFAVSVGLVIIAAFGWLQAMRMETLAGIGVLEASISVLGLIILSVIVFGEHVRVGTFVAAVFALGAVVIHTIWG